MNRNRLALGLVLVTVACGDESRRAEPPDTGDHHFVIGDDAAAWSTIVVDYPGRSNR